ncbi:S1C family serine protease [Haloplanus natans]|uniref:S1C family serine protease n=1 Tax=Haloplanus natans TaxID=376171 RepID=UPI0006777BC9|nr:trypsin-like peptidase domain-containing protein [Haloplanus natans]
MSRRRQFLTAIGSALTTVLAGCSALTSSDGVTSEGESPPTATGTPTSTPTSTPTPTPTPRSTPDGATESEYTQVYRETIDSVVLVRTPRGSLGSGFVYGDGTIVTNAHVAGNAERVEIVFSDGETRIGTVLGTDSLSDLAAIGVGPRPADAAPLVLADDEPAIGTHVAVIGSPLGLRNSLTSGIVSATNRLIPNPRANFLLPNAIQTDAPVNPGNSGGPLVGLDGTVLGVVNSGGGENIAFAISPSLVRRVVPDLVADGAYTHPFFGAAVSDVSGAIARVRDMRRTRGVLVTGVAENSPAARVLAVNDDRTTVGGFEVPAGGDIVLALDGNEVKSRQDFLSHLLLNTSPGETVRLDVLRGGETRTVEVVLGARDGG